MCVTVCDTIVIKIVLATDKTDYELMKFIYKRFEICRIKISLKF